jgi:N-acetyl-anhydromuramyl-L-alanine amidase AmpD
VSLNERSAAPTASTRHPDCHRSSVAGYVEVGDEQKIDSGTVATDWKRVFFIQGKFSWVDIKKCETPDPKALD